MAILEFSVCFI